MFFFEKKNQKTFACAVAVLSGEPRDSADKSFLLLFLKKEESSFLDWTIPPETA
jgi:hypothetical protein